MALIKKKHHLEWKLKQVTKCLTCNKLRKNSAL